MARPENQQEQSGLNVVQIGLNATDMPATLRLYSELFGFAKAGANAFVPGVPFLGVWPSS